LGLRHPRNGETVWTCATTREHWRAAPAALANNPSRGPNHAPNGLPTLCLRRPILIADLSLSLSLSLCVCGVCGASGSAEVRVSPLSSSSETPRQVAWWSRVSAGRSTVRSKSRQCYESRCVRGRWQ